MDRLDTFQVTLIAVAAIGGMMAGTCTAIKKMLGNGRARLALLLGYAVLGLSFGAAGLALGVVMPVFDVQTMRGALLLGAGSAFIGLFVLGLANLGSLITFRYMGLRVTIEPERPPHDRRSGDRDPPNEGRNL